MSQEGGEYEQGREEIIDEILEGVMDVSEPDLEILAMNLAEALGELIELEDITEEEAVATLIRKGVATDEQEAVQLFEEAGVLLEQDDVVFDEKVGGNVGDTVVVTIDDERRTTQVRSFDPDED